MLNTQELGSGTEFFSVPCHHPSAFSSLLFAAAMSSSRFSFAQSLAFFKEPALISSFGGRQNSSLPVLTLICYDCLFHRFGLYAEENVIFLGRDNSAMNVSLRRDNPSMNLSLKIPRLSSINFLFILLGATTLILCLNPFICGLSHRA